MKKIGIILLLLLMFISLVAQSKIKFDSLVYDFSNIKEENGPYVTDFIFTNTSDEALSLIKVKAG